MGSLLDYKSLAADYAKYHTHPMNRLCHAFGIPLIVLCVVRWTQFGGSFFPWASVVLLLYVFWSVPLALMMAAAVFGMAAVAPFLHPWFVAFLFLLGWAFQFVGHSVFEGRSPAFTKNLVHLLVGPVWVLEELAMGTGEPKKTG